MPLHYNDAVDDTMVLDRQSSFLGGQLSHIRGNLLNPNQAILLQDVDLETGGTTRTRRGFHAWGDLKALTSSNDVQGVHWFANGNYEYLLAVVNGGLRKMTSAGVWSTVEAATVPASEPAYFAQINDRVFVCAASTARPKYWTGANLAANAAGTILTDGPATASLLTSQKYRLFARDTAQNDSVYVTGYLPTTATPFGSFYPFRIGEGEGEVLTAMHAWKGFTLVAFKDSSSWLVDTTGVQVQTSGTWTDTTTTADYVVSRVSNRVGCVAERTVATVGNDLLFLSRDGVRSLGKTIEDGDGAVSEALSKPIDDYIDRINWAAVSTSCAAEWKGRYLLAVPLDTATSPNVVLVYHYRLNAWTVWTGLNPREFAVTRFSGAAQRLAMISGNGHVQAYRDYISMGSTVATDYKDLLDGATSSKVPYRIQSRSITWDEPLNPKLPDFIEIEWDHSSALVDVRIWKDGDYYGKIAQKLDTGSANVYLPVTLPFTLSVGGVSRDRMSLLHIGECREMVVDIAEAGGLTTTEDTASGPLVVRSILVGAFVETFPPDGASQTYSTTGSEVGT